MGVCNVSGANPVNHCCVARCPLCGCENNADPSACSPLACYRSACSPFACYRSACSPVACCGSYGQHGHFEAGVAVSNRRCRRVDRHACGSAHSCPVPLQALNRVSKTLSHNIIVHNSKMRASGRNPKAQYSAQVESSDDVVLVS